MPNVSNISSGARTVIIFATHSTSLQILSEFTTEIISSGFTDVNMNLDVFLNSLYDNSEIIKKSGGKMATDKRQFTLRIQDDTYEKMRYLAYVEHRSVSMEIETAMLAYISAYESEHGPIPALSPSEE